MTDGQWALIHVGVGVVALFLIFVFYILANRKYK